MAFPETWGPYFLVGLQRRGSSAQTVLQIAAMIDPTSLEINPGTRPVNLVTNAAGGGIYNQEPEEMGELTFDIISGVELSAASAVGLFQQFIGISGTSDPNAYLTSEPLFTDTTWPAGQSRNMDRFKLTVLWTNDAASTTAEGTTAISTDAKRFIAMNILFKEMKMNHSDNMPKYTAVFVFKPYSKDGTRKNYAWESADQTAMKAFGVASSAYTVATDYTTGNYGD